jgi:hypothetical protein
LVFCSAKAQVIETTAADSLLLSWRSSAFFAKDFQPSPKKATIYAAVFPGLGQIYNRKYWTVPILYGGFMGLAYAINWNNKYYKSYKNVYIDIMLGNRESFVEMFPYTDISNISDENLKASWIPGSLRQRKDVYRRWRDMSIAGVVGLYVLSVLDAYVDAQLFDFDISPDLSMHIEPVINSGFETASVGAKIQFRF